MSTCARHLPEPGSPPGASSPQGQLGLPAAPRSLPAGTQPHLQSIKRFLTQHAWGGRSDPKPPPARSLTARGPRGRRLQARCVQGHPSFPTVSHAPPTPEGWLPRENSLGTSRRRGRAGSRHRRNTATVQQKPRPPQQRTPAMYRALGPQDQPVAPCAARVLYIGLGPEKGHPRTGSVTERRQRRKIRKIPRAGHTHTHSHTCSTHVDMGPLWGPAP